MTSPELHADDLLDREARGSLTSEERVRLEEHLAVCSVCRFERSVRADFRAEFEALGPHRTQESALVGRTGSVNSGRKGIGRARVRVLGMVAVLLLLAGVAAAELAPGKLLAYVRWVSGTEATPQATASAPRLMRKQVPAAASARHSDPAGGVERRPEPRPESADARVAVEGPHGSSARPPRTAPSAAVAPSASTLFDEARAARERGDYEVAVERYERLLALFPSSPQALTTHAVLGRLLVDRGKPNGGLEHFDAYLASGVTTLGEEVMLGRALAFGKLGQSVQEAEAWQALLRAYPSSLHAARARERLNVLPAQ